MTDIGLILTYLMIGLAIIACIASPIIQIKNQPGKIKEMIIPIALLFCLFILSTLISSNEVLPEFTKSDGSLISAKVSKVVGGCLITFYILVFVAIGAVIYSEISKTFSK